MFKNKRLQGGGLTLILLAIIGFTFSDIYYAPTTQLRDVIDKSPLFKSTAVFSGGKEGKAGTSHYRIPALLLANDQSLLAFAEGRDSSSDSGAPGANINISLKRSHDLGAHWDSVQIIHSDPQFDYGDPSPILDKLSGDIFIFYAQFPDDCAFNGDCVNASHANDLFMRKSTDNGQTWQKAINLSPQIKAPTWRAIKPGPGVGRQLQHQKNTELNGRLVLPFVFRDSNSFSYTSTLYSDDHGQHWQKGKPTPFTGLGESDLIERNNGDLLMSSRHISGPSNSDNNLPESRFYFISQDAGITWQAHPSYGIQTTRVDTAYESYLDIAEDNTTLTSPPAEQKQVILFSAPMGMRHPILQQIAVFVVSDIIGLRGIANTINRFDLGLWFSKDGGSSFRNPIKIVDGFSAYSSMQNLNNEFLFVLYEEEPAKKISLLKIPFKELSP